MGGRVRTDQVERAKRVDLLDYLEAKGETFKKEGHYYRNTEHDSLIIRDQMYAWNSRGKKGAGVINFAQMYYGMSFPEAVRDITNSNYKEKERPPSEKKSAEPYRYPVHYEESDTTRMHQYLTQDRNIHPKVVDWLERKDYLAQDKRGNVVYKWKQQGEVIGAERQGTQPTARNGDWFKGIDKNSQGNAGFTFDIGKPKTLYVFESSVDALSYWSEKKGDIQNARILSMSGLKRHTVSAEMNRMNKDGYPPKQVIIAVDNDASGRDFAHGLKDVLQNYINQDGERVGKIDLPKEKDWNEQLQKNVAIEQQRLKEAQPSQVKDTELERS
ncbi:toprim domain-containing protein [Salicibibacter cibarius]|uniref:Toprim domain-containing protein n=1 Tax=Salicibibacter cibarius TaxID=2743000 RepID=A0A7T7CDB3_9BACI|nr:toprim domain-containing protein [Salicibibacter cibarius]QQK77824.1 toprim domain-containing protein [Salicibibacter cibarius]